MKTVTINVFSLQRNHYKFAINRFSEGYFATQGHYTFNWWVMDDDMDCKGVIKPVVINHLLECGFLVKRDNRLYKADDAPVINFGEV